jgi:hypothetical protein
MCSASSGFARRCAEKPRFSGPSIGSLFASANGGVAARNILHLSEKRSFLRTSSGKAAGHTNLSPDWLH